MADNDYGDCDSCKNPCLMKDLQDYLSLKVFIIFSIILQVIQQDIVS